MKFVLEYNEIFVEGNKAKGERSEKILKKYKCIYPDFCARDFTCIFL